MTGSSLAANHQLLAEVELGVADRPPCRGLDDQVGEKLSQQTPGTAI
jgi:hypothetical protein